MKVKQIFLALLGLQGAVEFMISMMLLFNFRSTLEQFFGITYSSPLEVFGLILGLYLLLLTSLIVLSIRWTQQGNPAGTALGMLIGAFLMAVAIGSFVKFGDVNAIYVDGIRGLLTLVLAIMTRKKAVNA